MTETEKFEIRVALVGYVSVGKSTVLNALLGEKFSAVSLKRSTAAVNQFRIIQPTEDEDNKEGSEPAQKKRRTKRDGEPTVDLTTWTAEATHAVIAKDNESLRSNDDDDAIVEKTFDIQVEDPICKMRNDTQLVLVDIPGINEADSSKKYKDYVENKWNTFDCVILVMDAIQGVNTEEQVQLLKFVEANNKNKKDIPTIILGNKVDDPDDSEKMVLVEEARAKCSEIFGPKCSSAALKELLEVAKDFAFVKENTKGAVFIPMSAMNAFIYRKAAHLTPETLYNFDKELLDKIGRDEVGRQWKSMNTEQKVKTIQDAINDTAAYEERLSDTNFDKFLTVLSYFVGGEDAQTELISSQVDVMKANITFKGIKSISAAMRDVLRICKALGMSTKGLEDRFWNAYKECEEGAFLKLGIKADPTPLESPFLELEQYYKLAASNDWKDEMQKTVDVMKNLLQKQLHSVISHHENWTLSGFLIEYGGVESVRFCEKCQEKCGIYQGCSEPFPRGGIACGWVDRGDDAWSAPETGPFDWKDLSPHDWEVILFSILLPSSELEFNLNYGKERNVLETLLQAFRMRFNPAIYNRFQNDSAPEHDRIYNQACENIGEDLDAQSAIMKLKIPDEMSDPSHWGYLGWKYIMFCRSLTK